jgi:tetratricopeptide (TPR) repeat protein
VKKPQWIVIVAGVLLVACLYKFGRTTPIKKSAPIAAAGTDNHEGHDHGDGDHEHDIISADTIIALSKHQLTPAQQQRILFLERSVTRGDIKGQQIQVYRQLARFWADSGRVFEPYAWYTAEAARLENSEKTLTFAAHLFLENLQLNNDPQLVRWRATQAKDLFERSLKINPDNDSSKVGLGASLLFGNISDAPMNDALPLIRGVVEKDSTNVFAQITLVKGALMSGQYDRAVARLQTVHRLQPGNIEVILMLADTYVQMGDKVKAAEWYKESLKHIDQAGIRTEIEKRIESLSK